MMLGVAVVVLAVHLGLGAVALYLLPHGFSLTNLHLWANTVIPAALVLANGGVLVRLAFARSKRLAVSAMVGVAAGAWIVGVVLGAILFPVSMTLERCVVPALVGVGLSVLARSLRERTVVSVLAMLSGGAAGAVVVLAQRAPLPSTRPSGGTLAEVRGPAVSDDAATGQIVAACGKEKMRVNPLLTFHSRSPDRMWTLFAPPDSFGPRRALSRAASTATGFRAGFKDDGESTLIAKKEGAALDIDAVSILAAPVYSHLNTFTAIHFSFEATISFGPTGATRFRIEPSDYPSGRPMQLAYLAEDLTFRVVRARDAEKGPYTELARGKLGRDEALTMEIRPRDEKEKGCRFVLKDWSAQLSTEPSPTAGWGVPQNSIQFFTHHGETLIALTLAETGPGRGFDSVGHAEGAYKNRVRIEPLR